MKKCLSLLIALLLACSLTCAMAEAAPAAAAPVPCPLSPLPQPEQMFTHWQLYATEPAPRLDMTAASDPESNCFMIVLNELDLWGVAAEHMGCWVYDTEALEWQALETDIQPENGAVLMIDAQYYYMNGFPGWGFTGADGAFAYRLEDYSTDPNNPKYILQYACETGSVEVSLADGSFTLRSFGQDTMSYCVYSKDAVLELGTYMTEDAEGTYASWAMIPDEAEGGEGYVLYYINVQNADGDNLLWTDGVWMNLEGFEEPAPEGFSAQELPFELIEN